MRIIDCILFPVYFIGFILIMLFTPEETARKIFAVDLDDVYRQWDEEDRKQRQKGASDGSSEKRGGDDPGRRCLYP